MNGSNEAPPPAQHMLPDQKGELSFQSDVIDARLHNLRCNSSDCILHEKQPADGGGGGGVSLGGAGGAPSQPAKATTLLFPCTLHHPLCKWRHNAIFTYESTAKQIASAVVLLHKRSQRNEPGSRTHLLFLNVQLLTREH